MNRPHAILLIWLVILSLALPALAPAAAGAVVAPALATCSDLVINGGFENPGGWTPGVTPTPPQYVTNPVYSGARAARLGNVDQLNQLSYSSIRQPITIPGSAASAQISFWVWTQHESSPGNDLQEALLLFPGARAESSTPVKVVWRTLANERRWVPVTVSLNDVIGTSFDLYFNVFNNGTGGRSAMFLDEVVLTICDSAGPTATPTPTTTPGGGVNVSWVGNLNPPGNNPQTRTSAETLYVTTEVYAAGVTNVPGQGAGIQCWLHWGSVPAFGQPWNNTTDTFMSYAGDAGNNDRYGVGLGPLAPGLYEYTAWCSGNGGATKVWADIAGSGGNGRLTVVPAAATPTPTPTSAAPVNITWVGNLNPNGLSTTLLNPSGVLPVTVQVYAPGVTEGPGQGAGIACGLEFSPVAYFGGPWNSVLYQPMFYNGDVGNDDRYRVDLGPLPPGLYEYTAWCSGNGGVTKVWSDNAATGGNGRVQVVGPTVTPSAVPTVPPPITPGPTPVDCGENLIENGGFEWDGVWLLGPTQLMPAYVGTPNPFRGGTRSLRLGNPNASQPAVESYSSARQVISIPAYAQTAHISFWYYPISEATPGGFSRQELILLDPFTNATVAILWRATENDRFWKERVIDLTPYRGRTVAVYFNARNGRDGRRTAMYLDDVSARACGAIYAPQPQPYYPTGAEVPQPATAAAGAYTVNTPDMSSYAVGTPAVSLYTVGTPTPGVTTVSVGPTPVPTKPDSEEPAPLPPATPVGSEPDEEGEGGESEFMELLRALGPWALVILLVLIIGGALITIRLLR